MELLVLLGGGTAVGVLTVVAMNAWDRRVEQRRLATEASAPVVEPDAAEAEGAAEPATASAPGLDG